MHTIASLLKSAARRPKKHAYINKILYRIVVMYGISFALNWTALIVVLVAWVVCTVFGVVFNTWWFVGTLIGGLVSVWARLHSQRINMRAALNICARGQRPKTLEEFTSLCLEKKYTVVGSGWASYLNRKKYRNCLFTSQLNKRVMRNNTYTWETGASIGQIMKELQKENKTLSRYPSMEWVTLGGWISTWSHGHPGTDKLTPPVKEATVLNTMTRQVSTFDWSNFMRLFEQKNRTNVVLTMTVNPIDDFAVERIARPLVTEADTRWWLNTESVGRLIFVGSRGALGLVWKRTDEEPVQTYNVGVFGQWWSIDINSYLNCDTSLKKVARTLNSDRGKYQTLSRAMQVVPNLMGEYMLLPILLGIYNFEVYVNIRNVTFATFLQNIVGFHTMHGGRSELRLYGHIGILAIDWAVHYSKVREVFEFMARNEYNTVALHWGKKMVDVEPCTKVKLIDLIQTK